MTTKFDNNLVPKDYEELYRHYMIGAGNGNALCPSLIRKMMPYADQDERETLVHDVWLRMREKDMLRVFDPTKANFGGMVFVCTRTVVANHLARKSRNPVTGLKGGTLTDQESNRGESFEPGLYSLDRLFVTETPDPGAKLDLLKLWELVHETLQEMHESPRHKRDECLLPLLEMLAQECDPEEAAAKLGVTTSTIHNWVGIIRELALELKERWLSPRKEQIPPGEMLPIEE